MMFNRALWIPIQWFPLKSSPCTPASVKRSGDTVCFHLCSTSQSRGTDSVWGCLWKIRGPKAMKWLTKCSSRRVSFTGEDGNNTFSTRSAHIWGGLVPWSLPPALVDVLHVWFTMQSPNKPFGAGSRRTWNVWNLWKLFAQRLEDDCHLSCRRKEQNMYSSGYLKHQSWTDARVSDLPTLITIIQMAWSAFP